MRGRSALLTLVVIVVAVVGWIGGQRSREQSQRARQFHELTGGPIDLGESSARVARSRWVTDE